jgi:hypothetical protein
LADDVEEKFDALFKVLLGQPELDHAPHPATENTGDSGLCTLEPWMKARIERGRRRWVDENRQ